MTQEANCTPFGLAQVKREGYSYDPATGETWLTTAAEKECQRLQAECKELRLYCAYLTLACAGLFLTEVAFQLYKHL